MSLWDISYTESSFFPGCVQLSPKQFIRATLQSTHSVIRCLHTDFAVCPFLDLSLDIHLFLIAHKARRLAVKRPCLSLRPLLLGLAQVLGSHPKDCHFPIGAHFLLNQRLKKTPIISWIKNYVNITLKKCILNIIILTHFAAQVQGQNTEQFVCDQVQTQSVSGFPKLQRRSC